MVSQRIENQKVLIFGYDFFLKYLKDSFKLS